MSDEITPQDGENVNSAAQLPWWKKKGTWIVVALAVVVIIALIFGLSSKGDNPAADLEGAQTALPEPAQGTREAISSLELKIDGDVAPVDFVQLTDQGSLLPPTDVSRLGWYSASAIPGEEGPVGSSVITGHINEVEQGEGYAARFLNLKEGDTVTVVVDGEERDFQVSKAPVEVVKGADLPESVNDATGENRLVLVTCGGEYVGGTLGYADNVIVEATPVV